MIDRAAVSAAIQAQALSPCFRDGSPVMRANPFALKAVRARFDACRPSFTSRREAIDAREA